jgi:hypothetical protein
MSLNQASFPTVGLQLMQLGHVGCEVVVSQGWATVMYSTGPTSTLPSIQRDKQCYVVWECEWECNTEVQPKCYVCEGGYEVAKQWNPEGESNSVNYYKRRFLKWKERNYNNPPTLLLIYPLLYSILLPLRVPSLPIITHSINIQHDSYMTHLTEPLFSRNQGNTWINNIREMVGVGVCWLVLRERGPEFVGPMLVGFPTWFALFLAT